jgi:hypothetical protein
MTAAGAGNGAKRMVRAVALTIAWVWAVGWVILGAMFGTGGLEGWGAVIGAVIQAIIPGVFFVGVALIATRWALAGGVALMLVGALAGVLYPTLVTNQSMGAVVFIEAAMAAPGVVAGALLILAKPRVERSPDAAPPAGDLP